jgi:uncharacterized Ntn-hydrolase superfamily protein
MKFSTFSIVAYEVDENSFGVAVASKFLSVGAYVPFAKAGVGAIATQAYANLSYGDIGLTMLSEGKHADEVVAQLVSHDDGRDERQLGVVDFNGNAATYTGKKCMRWAGGMTGKGFAIQGNILAGESVIQDMASAFQSASGELADRLYAALHAGEHAGGDRRGRQSAALLVVKPNGGYGGFTDRYVDLRVDDHLEPVPELNRLLQLHRLYFGKTDARDKIKMDATIMKLLQHAARSRGFQLDDDLFSEETISTLNDFIGSENLEERIDLSNAAIDPPALDYLRERFRQS